MWHHSPLPCIDRDVVQLCTDVTNWTSCPVQLHNVSHYVTSHSLVHCLNTERYNTYTNHSLTHCQGGHSTRKTGNLDVNFSRQAKHREFGECNFFRQGKLWQHRENFENLEFFENYAIKLATRCWSFSMLPW